MMNMKNTLPKTNLGRWSVILHIFFLLSITISIILVKVFRILSFDDSWWDVTVAVTFSSSIIALGTGTLAVKKHKENSVLVYLSIIIGWCVILFIITHSLFISD